MSKGSQRVRKAVIPAAGLGTRFLPATKAIPKEMLPIVDIPTVQYIVEEAVASGIEEILIITNSNKHCMENHFDKDYELEARLNGIRQDERSENDQRYCQYGQYLLCASERAERPGTCGTVRKIFYWK